MNRIKSFYKEKLTKEKLNNIKMSKGQKIILLGTETERYLKTSERRKLIWT